ncbi:MAG: hypothetical protein V3V57_04290 [Spirochaetia bacterium]
MYRSITILLLALCFAGAATCNTAAEPQSLIDLRSNALGGYGGHQFKATVLHGQFALYGGLWVEYDPNLRSRGISPPQHYRDDADELGRRLSIHDSLRRAARSEQLGFQRSHSDHPATPSRAAALAGIGDLLSYSERPAGAGCGSGFR